MQTSTDMTATTFTQAEGHLYQLDWVQRSLWGEKRLVGIVARARGSMAQS